MPESSGSGINDQFNSGIECFRGEILSRLRKICSATESEEARAAILALMSIVKDVEIQSPSGDDTPKNRALRLSRFLYYTHTGFDEWVQMVEYEISQAIEVALKNHGIETPQEDHEPPAMYNLRESSESHSPSR